MEWGADAAEINRAIFDTKSQGRLAAESALIRSIRYFCGGRLAVAVMDLATIAETGAGPADFDGLTALPRQVEGVEIGVTLREDVYKRQQFGRPWRARQLRPPFTVCPMG